MYLENDIIKLRALEPEDLETLYKWENDTEMWELGSTLSPYSHYDLQQFIASSHDLYEARQLRLMVDLKETAETIGAIDLFDFDPYHQRACIGMLIAKEFRYKSYGRKALTLLCTFAFSFLKIHQLYAYIPADNRPCVHLFETSGFKRVGVLQDWLRTKDGYKEVFLFSLISDFWDS